MTDEMMSLRTLLEKSADGDLLREMVGFAAQGLMELEVESLTGAAHGERRPDRINHRNGYRDRDWETRAGTVELRIPSSGSDDQIDAAAIGQLAHILVPLRRLAVIDHFGCTKGLEPVCLFRGRGRRHGPGTQQAGELQGEDRDTPEPNVRIVSPAVTRRWPA
jgi:Transposase, Mutator family